MSKFQKLSVRTSAACLACVVLLSLSPLLAQDSPAAGQPAPIYHVTVIQRSLDAVNYGHRSLPTRLDFRGTVLAPDAKGSATVEAKPGAVVIHAKFDGLNSPGRYGSQYLTYVLWAISPEGQTDRLAGIITNQRDSARPG